VNAGISDEAALVFKYVLMVGTLTIGEVCEYTSFDFDVASKALKELVDGRLVRKLQHVVDRYVAVAPYRAFAEHLVEFQKIIRDVEENAKKSIDATLLEVSRVNEEWKGSSIRLREEELSRAKLETGKLKEECQEARNILTEKVRRETEERKSRISETLKKHVEEHATRISDVKRDVSLGLDNSAAKFAETTRKLKEEATQATSSYLSRFEEKTQQFLSTVNSDLSAFRSEFSSSADNFRTEVFAALEASNTKIGELTETIKTGANTLLREVGQTYGQLSTAVQSTVSNNTSAAVTTISSGNKELESNLKDALEKHGVKIGEDINSFQTKTSESIDIWRSAYKGELESHAKNLKLAIEGCQQDLVKNLESAKASVSDLLKTHSASAKSATDTLGSNLDSMTESIKKDISLKLTAPKEELQKSCDVAAKNCVALASTLESLSKKNIPLTSKTIDDFTKEFGDKVSRMKVTLIEDAKSFVGQMKESLTSTLSGTEEASKSPGNTRAGTRAKSLLIKEVAKRIDDAGKGHIEAVKKGVDALGKSTSERVASVLRFEDELAKRWESIAATMGKVTELAGKIKLVPSEIGKPVDELLDQYLGKVNESLSSTRRLLNAHLLSLSDQASSTVKKWSSTLDKTKKEISDLFIKKQEEELGAFASRQIDVLQKIATDRTKELVDLATSKVETLKSQTLTMQSTINKHMASNTELVRGSLNDIENKLKRALEASAQEFALKTESKCKENEDSSARIIGETAKAVADLKEQLNSVINGEKEKVNQICENAGSKLKETTSENSRELNGIVSSLTNSFATVIDAVSEGYKKECESTKVTVITLLSEHLKNYTEAVTKIIGEIGSTFSKHFDDCNELTTSFQKKLDELLTTHQNGYEASSNKMLSGLVNCIDQDEKAISQDARKMLKEFTDNTTKIAKESNSVETLLKTAWAEITDTQQINADKTWHCVTKRAILNHLKDMTKRTKSTVTVVVPNLDEVPLKEIKEVSRAIRINIVAGVDEALHKKLLKELLAQGNVRIWNLMEKDYISCTRDAEEVLVAPVAKRDLDCVATVSVEENYVKLYHKFIGPMWMASAREVKEKELR
jgi:hypothetical protein